MTEQKRCTKCKEELELDKFARDASRRDGLSCWCRECKKPSRVRPSAVVTQKNREWYSVNGKSYREANKEAIKKQYQKWYDKNGLASAQIRRGRRRARLANLPYEDVSAQMLIDRDGNLCWMCGKVPVTTHMEHYIPVAANPEELKALGITNPGNVLANMSIACESCNPSKGFKVMLCAVARYLRNVNG